MLTSQFESDSLSDGHSSLVELLRMVALTPLPCRHTHTHTHTEGEGERERERERERMLTYTVVHV